MTNPVFSFPTLPEIPYPVSLEAIHQRRDILETVEQALYHIGVRLRAEKGYLKAVCPHTNKDFDDDPRCPSTRCHDCGSTY